MNKKDKIIRCVNLDSNKVKYFPESICNNEWWQKNTRFIPQQLDIVVNESTIINENELSEVASVNANEITGVTSDVLEIKTKRKYKKRKTS